MHSMLLELEIYSGEGVGKKVGEWLFVRKCVCSSILTSGDQTAGPIGTGVAPFDAPERRNDDGAGHVTTRVTCHVPRARK